VPIVTDGRKNITNVQNRTRHHQGCSYQIDASRRTESAVVGRDSAGNARP